MFWLDILKRQFVCKVRFFNLEQSSIIHNKCFKTWMYIIACNCCRAYFVCLKHTHVDSGSKIINNVSCTFIRRPWMQWMQRNISSCSNLLQSFAKAGPNRIRLWWTGIPFHYGRPKPGCVHSLPVITVYKSSKTPLTNATYRHLSLVLTLNTFVFNGSPHCQKKGVTIHGHCKYNWTL